MKNISILGSTGSIGIQTLDIVREYNEEFNIVSLAANNNIELLEKQIREFTPSLVCVYNEEQAGKLKENIKDLSTKVVSKMDGLVQCAAVKEADTVVTAIVGMIGILPTIAAIKEGKDIALANKETLVTAGHIIMPLVKEHNVSLLPVDSEHSAIFQALQGEDKDTVKQIILTASGGPFRGRNLSQLQDITPEEALKHPNWSMGSKITIDSATMVNKGLEVMEAAWLFDIDIDKIKVIVHPQSIIHSMVEYVDNSIIGQLGVPDMAIPIQYALFYPGRKELVQGERLDLIKLQQLTFEEADMETFKGLKLGYQAANTGGSMPTVYNAANEWAVARFLQGKISFTDIPSMISEAMGHHKLILNPNVNEILISEEETYDFLKTLI